MKKIKRIFLFIILLNFMNSCGGISDAGKVLRNEKINSTDEFLVKKRAPLTMPPDYSKIPKPDSLEKSNIKNENSINKILKIPNEKDSQKKTSSSVEQSIINKISK